MRIINDLREQIDNPTIILKNKYGNELELTPDEVRVINTIMKYTHDYSEYDKQLYRTIHYKSTYYMESTLPLYYESKMNRDDFIRAFYHLLLNGIVEKVFSYDKKSKKYLFRIPVEKKEHYRRKNQYFDDLYLKQKEEAYNRWMNS